MTISSYQPSIGIEIVENGYILNINLRDIEKPMSDTYYYVAENEINLVTTLKTLIEKHAEHSVLMKEKLEEFERKHKQKEKEEESNKKHNKDEQIQKHKIT